MERDRRSDLPAIRLGTLLHVGVAEIHMRVEHASESDGGGAFRSGVFAATAVQPLRSAQAPIPEILARASGVGGRPALMVD